MGKRFVTIWFRYLKTDWLSRRNPELLNIPFVLSSKEHNRVIVSAINSEAGKQGITIGMPIADARAIFPGLKIYDDKPGWAAQLLTSFAKYCIRYTPVTAIDLPDGLILDVTGCSHLWGGEHLYIMEIINRFQKFGYNVKAAIADTIGAAWATTHFTPNHIVEKNQHQSAILPLQAAALRLEPETLELLYKLGLSDVQSFINMPRSALSRRFGNNLIRRLDQALGSEEETVHPVLIPEPFHERLPCPELISTATGIEIALQRLLENLCQKLRRDQKGLRCACLKCYRIDGKIEKAEIGTNQPSHNAIHLFKLFQLKITSIEPSSGIELFTLDAFRIEVVVATQEKLWSANAGLKNLKFAELLDRIAIKIGSGSICRYLPNEHHWPERSVKMAASLHEEMTTEWKTEKTRPVQILTPPDLIQVTAPIPDYPPMLFRYKNKLHTIIKADGPERIEVEWWLEEGLHRDYYSVEDEEGNRFWLYRLGHYTSDEKPQWFIHGFFA